MTPLTTALLLASSGDSPPGSVAPPAPTSGTLTMQPADPNRPTGAISYWRTRTSEDQPPDFTGTIEAVRAWMEANPPMPEGGILELEGTKMLAFQKGLACGPSIASMEALDADLKRRLYIEPPSTLLEVVHDSQPFDTSMPFYEMQKQAQRATTKTPAPTLYGSSRAQRRASGDRRTVKQIIASQKGR